jgi:hypothetical protein
MREGGGHCTGQNKGQGQRPESLKSLGETQAYRHVSRAFLSTKERNLDIGVFCGKILFHLISKFLYKFKFNLG